MHHAQRTTHNAYNSHFLSFTMADITEADITEADIERFVEQCDELDEIARLLKEQEEQEDQEYYIRTAISAYPHLNGLSPKFIALYLCVKKKKGTGWLSMWKERRVQINFRGFVTWSENVNGKWERKGRLHFSQMKCTVAKNMNNTVEIKQHGSNKPNRFILFESNIEASNFMKLYELGKGKPNLEFMRLLVRLYDPPSEFLNILALNQQSKGK